MRRRSNFTNLLQCLQASHVVHKENHIAEGLAAAAIVSTVDQQSLNRKQGTKKVNGGDDTAAAGPDPRPTSFGRSTPVTADVPHRLQTQTHKADAADKQTVGRQAQKCAPQAVSGSSGRKSLQPALQKELEHRLRDEAGADRDRHRDRLGDSSRHSCRDTSCERHCHQRDKDTAEKPSRRREDSSQRQDMLSHRHKPSDRHHGSSASRHRDFVFLPGKQDTYKSVVKHHVHRDADGNTSSDKSQSQWGVTSKDYKRDRQLSDIGRSRVRQHDRKRSRSPHESSNDSRFYQNR